MRPAASRPELSPGREQTVPRRPQSQRPGCGSARLAKSTVVKLSRDTFETARRAEATTSCGESRPRIKVWSGLAWSGQAKPGTLGVRVGRARGGAGKRSSSSDEMPSREPLRAIIPALQDTDGRAPGGCSRAGGPSSGVVEVVRENDPHTGTHLTFFNPSISTLLRNDGRASNARA